MSERGSEGVREGRREGDRGRSGIKEKGVRGR